MLISVDERSKASTSTGRAAACFSAREARPAQPLRIAHARPTPNEPCAAIGAGTAVQTRPPTTATTLSHCTGSMGVRRTTKAMRHAKRMTLECRIVYSVMPAC